MLVSIQGGDADVECRDPRDFAVLGPAQTMAATPFEANREINREFSKIRPLALIFAPSPRVNPGVCSIDHGTQVLQEADANKEILGLGAFGCRLRLVNVHIDTRLPDREMDLGRNGSVQVRPPNTVLGYAIRVECAHDAFKRLVPTTM